MYETYGIAFLVRNGLCPLSILNTYKSLVPAASWQPSRPENESKSCRGLPVGKEMLRATPVPTIEPSKNSPLLVEQFHSSTWRYSFTIFPYLFAVDSCLIACFYDCCGINSFALRLKLRRNSLGVCCNPGRILGLLSFFSLRIRIKGFCQISP